ncbi:hypothetical protein [Kluyvera intermedia]|uniref:hypothetical protein n=1 Tax=Kluyvera intermedia TaxID=61648 RepID=UPI0039F55721
MMNYALITNDIVTNVVICDSDELANLMFSGHKVVKLQDSYAGIGWGYDGLNFIGPDREGNEELFLQDEPNEKL